MTLDVLPCFSSGDLIDCRSVDVVVSGYHNASLAKRQSLPDLNNVRFLQLGKWIIPPVRVGRSPFLRSVLIVAFHRAKEQMRRIDTTRVVPVRAVVTNTGAFRDRSIGQHPGNAMCFMHFPVRSNGTVTRLLRVISPKPARFLPTGFVNLLPKSKLHRDASGGALTFDSAESCLPAFNKTRPCEKFTSAAFTNAGNAGPRTDTLSGRLTLGHKQNSHQSALRTLTAIIPNNRVVVADGKWDTWSGVPVDR